MGFLFRQKDPKEARAYWIQHTHLLRRDEYECSNCRRIQGRAFGRCPSCGAKMRASKYDPSWVDEAAMIEIIIDDD